MRALLGFWITFLLLVWCQVCISATGDPTIQTQWDMLEVAEPANFFPKGGNRFISSHALPDPIPGDWHLFGSDDLDIKEFHFHVYFAQNNKEAVADAFRLQRELLQAVKEKKFICVLHGISNKILSAVNVSAIPPINMAPIGPHPMGSFEVWTPREYLASVLSFMMRRRGENSVLLHPLSRHCVEDHYGRAIFLGPPSRLDLKVLDADSRECDHAQYPELRLGYSA